MESFCNADCNCTTESYDPICGDNNIEYFSPCHAGCTDVIDDGDDPLYTDCSCVWSSDDDVSVRNATASPGICAQDCDVFGLFLFLFLCINLTTFISSTAGQAATLRQVQYTVTILHYSKKILKTMR